MSKQKLLKKIGATRDFKFIIFFGITFLISIKIYSLYFTNLTFGDEYDNFTYAWLLKSGQLPYREFFTHHFPSLIFLGVPVELLGHSKLFYRLFVLTATFSLFTFSSFYLVGVWRYVSLLFMLVSSFSISLYGGFQYADGMLWSLTILTGFFIVLKKQGENFTNLEAFLFSFVALLTVLSSPMHILAFVFLLAYHTYLKSKMEVKNKIHKLFHDARLLSVFFSIDLAVFFIYLIATKSAYDFYQSTFVFNNQYFYEHVYRQWIGPKFLDFYLHTTWDVYNHFSQLVTRQGPYLISFIKSSKFLIPTYSHPEGYFRYLTIISTSLYNNFFTYEVFIALFVIFGIISLFITKRFSLAFFSLIFLLSQRLRLNELVHMAPYYLFSLWLLSCSVIFYTHNIILNKRRLMSFLFLIFVFLLGGLFIAKNWYDFNQTAFNRFQKKNSKTVDYLANNSNASEKILVVSGESASYYYDSSYKQFGYFVNYFPWYDQSPRLRRIWLKDLADYNGRFLIVPESDWISYIKNPDDYDGWLKQTFETIKNLYISTGIENENDIIFTKKFSDQDK